jgi:hypothetical protein
VSSYDATLCSRDRVPEMGHRGVPEMGHQSHPVMSRYRYIRPRPTTGTYIDSLYHGKTKGLPRRGRLLAEIGRRMAMAEASVLQARLANVETVLAALACEDSPGKPNGLSP